MACVMRLYTRVAKVLVESWLLSSSSIESRQLSHVVMASRRRILFATYRLGTLRRRRDKMMRAARLFSSIVVRTCTLAAFLGTSGLASCRLARRRRRARPVVRREKRHTGTLLRGAATSRPVLLST